MAREAIRVGDVTVRPGERQFGFLHVAYLAAKTEVRVPFQVLHGVEGGPTVCLESTLHGWEPMGAEVLRRALLRVDPLDCDLPLLPRLAELLPARRVDATNELGELAVLDDALEAELGRAASGPDAGRLAATGVVVVEAGGDRALVVELLPRRQLGDAQHGVTSASGCICVSRAGKVSRWGGWSLFRVARGRRRVAVPRVRSERSAFRGRNSRV